MPGVQKGTLKRAGLNIIHINTDRGKAAHDILNAMAAQTEADILIVSEPNKKIATQSQWLLDQRKDAAIKVVNKRIKIIKQGSEAGFVWAKIQGITIISCYISPNCDISEFEEFLQRLEIKVKTTTGDIVVAGDFNSKSPDWGELREDRRGNILASWIASNSLIIANQGNKPTFQRRGNESILDLTLTNEGLAGKLLNRRVLENETLSYHNAISYQTINTERNPPAKTTRKGWRVGLTEKEAIGKELKKQLTKSKKHTPEECTAALETACDKLFPKRRDGVRRKEVYWWNQEISLQRAICLKARRTMGRAQNKQEAGFEELQRNYKAERKKLKLEILKAKENKWKET